MVVSRDSQDASTDKFASKLARFEFLSRENVPFRHPDFSDDQIRQLTEIARSCRSSPSVTWRRSASGQHSGCSSPVLSPTVQRLRSQGFAPLARCGSDPLLTGAPPQTAMNTGSLPSELLAQTVSSYPSVPSSGIYPRYGRSKMERQKSKETTKISIGTGSSSEKELIASLVNRLMAVETELSYARQNIRQREFHITVLEERLRLYMKAEEDAGGGRGIGFLESLKDSRISNIEAKCSRLERQVMEMERFLSEYGMVWCEDENTYIMDPSLHSGSSSESDATSRTASPARTPREYSRGRTRRNRRHHHSRELRRVIVESTSRSISSEAEPFILDYDQLLAGITEINLQTQGDAVAESRESLQFTLYKNGFVIGEDTPFRSFDQIETRRILQDLLDGIFPSELQDAYPNGVPIKVRDKRQVIFLPKSRSKKEGKRPPVPPKPPLTQGDSGVAFSPLTSVTSFVGGSVCESEANLPTGPEEGVTDIPYQATPVTTESTRLCPEIEYKSESSEFSSRRNSFQKTSDKSEGEMKLESSSRRGSEVLVPPEPPPPSTSVHLVKEAIMKPISTTPRIVGEPQQKVCTDRRRTSIIAEGRRGSESRRMSDTRRMSDARRLTEGRRGSEFRVHGTRRRSDARRLDFDFTRRMPTRHPLDWNRINRMGYPPHEETLEPNISQLRRGSVGISLGGEITTESYDMENLRKRRTSVEDFLSKVPTCVVKSGRLVNLREEFTDMIMGSHRKSSMTLVHTPVLDEAGESQEGTDPDDDSPEQGTSSMDKTRATLRIKVENGSETYLIKLKASDSLDALRAYLKSYRGTDQEFDIIRPYPHEILTKSEATMAQLGLVPNAVLHLRCKGEPPPSSTSELLPSMIVSSGAPSSTFGSYSAFVPSSTSIFEHQDRLERGKDSQDSGIGILSFARPLEADLETPSSYLSSIIASSSSLMTTEAPSGKKSSQKVSVSGSYSQTTVGAVPTATPSPTPSPRHSPCPSLPTIPPNLHPALAPTIPMFYPSKDQGSETPSTSTTTTTTT